MITGKEQAFAGPSDTGYQPGMDLRTWMATQIMAALCSRGYTADYCAPESVLHADALIAELNKQPAP